MLSISLQAGGQSSRMGRNKALASFLGAPLILRILKRVEQLSDDIYVTSNLSEPYSALDLKVYPDVLPGKGALGGLITALHYARYDFVAVIACDLPFIHPSLIEKEYKWMLEKDCDVVIPRTERGLEPLHAVYRVKQCLPAALRTLRFGKSRMISWFSDVRVCEMHESEIKRIDPDLLSFMNVNTPDEFTSAELLAVRIEKG